MDFVGVVLFLVIGMCGANEHYLNFLSLLCALINASFLPLDVSFFLYISSLKIFSPQICLIVVLDVSYYSEL
jgi:hypothetical protein